jgi:hypothetical protein
VGSTRWRVTGNETRLEEHKPKGYGTEKREPLKDQTGCYMYEMLKWEHLSGSRKAAAIIL